MASLGRFTIERIYWTGQNALTCLVTTEVSGQVFQLYSGRKLVGVTNRVGETLLTGQVIASRCPSPITVLMVALSERDTDFGSRLPDRPWNKYKLRWTAEETADAADFSIHQSAAPGEAVDYSQELLRTPYAGPGNYTQELPELELCGEWSWGIVARDDAADEGNGDNFAEYSATVLLYPPDVLTAEDDTRMVVSIDAGNVSIDFEYDWPD